MYFQFYKQATPMAGNSKATKKGRETRGSQFEGRGGMPHDAAGDARKKIYFDLP
jgi:hypothetical protein